MKFTSTSDTIENLISAAMDKMKTIVDTSVVVGDKVETADGTTIFPISKVSVGYVVGGGEYADLSSRRVANHFPMAGGSSGGMSVTPVGFMVVSNGDVKYINVENKSLYQTVLNLFNSIISKLDENNNQAQEMEGEEEVQSDDIDFNLFGSEDDDED